VEFFPVIESDELFALDRKKSTTEYTIVGKGSLKSLELGEVLKHLNCAVLCPASIRMCLAGVD
jgi:hypothetical protein